MIFLRTNASPGEDFHSHSSADNISRGKILSRGGISGHEPFSESVSQDTALTSAALSHEAASAINTSWVELNELEIREGETCSGNHSTSVPSAGVGRGAGLIGTSISSCCDDGVESSDSVDGSVSDTHADYTSAGSLVVHYQVQGKVFDEEGAVIGEGSSKESM